MVHQEAHLSGHKSVMVGCMTQASLTTKGGHVVVSCVSGQGALARTCERKSVAVMTHRAACKAFLRGPCVARWNAVQSTALWGETPHGTCCNAHQIAVAEMRGCDDAADIVDAAEGVAFGLECDHK